MTLIESLSIVSHSISLSCGKMKAIATPHCFHRIRGQIEVSQLCSRRGNLPGNKSPFVITFSYRDSIARPRNVELKIPREILKSWSKDLRAGWNSILHLLIIVCCIILWKIFNGMQLFCNYLDNFNGRVYRGLNLKRSDKKNNW